MKCTSHHKACDCREDKFLKVLRALEIYRKALLQIRLSSGISGVAAEQALEAADKLVQEKAKPKIQLINP